MIRSRYHVHKINRYQSIQTGINVELLIRNREIPVATGNISSTRCFCRGDMSVVTQLLSTPNYKGPSSVPAAGIDSQVHFDGAQFLVDLKAAYVKNVGTILGTGQWRLPPKHLGIVIQAFDLWSHPPGSNRRPADYEVQSPAPSTPCALYGGACYQQLGEAALAQIATPDTPNRWGFDTVLAQVVGGTIQAASMGHDTQRTVRLHDVA